MMSHSDAHAHYTTTTTAIDHDVGGVTSSPSSGIDTTYGSYYGIEPYGAGYGAGYQQW